MKVLLWAPLVLGALTLQDMEQDAGSTAARTTPQDATEAATSAVASSTVPGLAVAAYRGGELISLGAAGVRSAEDETPVTTEDLWHLGSCTKAMTATLAAIAVEQGLLRFESTLGELLGERDFELHADLVGIRFSQLLDHTSGLANQYGDLWARYFLDKRPAREVRRELIGTILSQAPEAPPGSRFEYSNFGYIAAGVVLEELYDLDWEALMRRELFEPLGMDSAGFGAPGTAGKLDQPLGHRRGSKGQVPVPVGPRADNPAWLGPAGTVHATLEDWGKFLMLHVASLQGEAEKTLLSAETIARLHTPEEGRDYALGWSVTQRGWAGGLALTHSGSNTTWFAVCWLSPARELAVFAATNTASEDASAACDHAIQLVLADALKSR